jgi:hypothetical protein
MSVTTFGETYDIGRTKTYEEINAGRLKARKVGRRTIITAEDAEEWLSLLPGFHQALDNSADESCAAAEVGRKELARLPPPAGQSLLRNPMAEADTVEATAARPHRASEEKISS